MAVRGRRRRRLSTNAAARAIAAWVRAVGYDARIEAIDDKAPDDVPERRLGFDVRSRRFAEQTGADARTAALVGSGLSSARTVLTGEDGRHTSGPWVIDVLDIDPRAS